MEADAAAGITMPGATTPGITIARTIIASRPVVS
jgi:hypothetical protein